MKATFFSMIAAVLMIAGSASAVDMPPLAKKLSCDACHSIDQRKVGPAWRDVSKAYNNVGATGSAVNSTVYKVSNKVTDILAKNNAKTVDEWLLRKVSQGGSGNWGSMPMPANDMKGDKEADIKELVKFILGLEKK